MNLIKEHGSLDAVVEYMTNDPIGSKKFTIPEDWPYKEARELFVNPDVLQADHPDCDIQWTAPDIPGLIQFLVVEKGFSEDRVRSAADKLNKTSKSAQQARLEGFFKPVPKTEEQKKELKRKAEDKKETQKKKQKVDAKAKKEAKSKPRATG